MKIAFWAGVAAIVGTTVALPVYIYLLNTNQPSDSTAWLVIPMSLSLGYGMGIFGIVQGRNKQYNEEWNKVAAVIVAGIACGNIFVTIAVLGIVPAPTPSPWTYEQSPGTGECYEFRDGDLVGAVDSLYCEGE